MRHETGACSGFDGRPVEDCRFLGGRVSVEVVKEDENMVVRKITFSMI